MDLQSCSFSIPITNSRKFSREITFASLPGYASRNAFGIFVYEKEPA